MIVDRVLEGSTHYAVTDEDAYNAIQYILDNPVAVMDYAEYWQSKKTPDKHRTTTTVYRIYRWRWFKIWENGEWLDGVAKTEYLKIKMAKPHEFVEIYKPDHPSEMDIDVGYRWKAHVIDDRSKEFHELRISLDLWQPSPFHTEPVQFRVRVTKCGIHPWFNNSYSCMTRAETEAVTRILDLALEYYEYLQKYED